MTEVKFMVLEFNFNGSWIVCVVSYSKKKNNNHNSKPGIYHQDH